jgi:membrane protein CcdC involved in cytochrome C biogenesis
VIRRLRDRLPNYLMAAGIVLAAFSIFRTYPWQAGTAIAIVLMLAAITIHVDREERKP